MGKVFDQAWETKKKRPEKKPSRPRDCYDPAKCRIKQVQARKLEAMGERRVHLKWCAVCDRGIEAMPKEATVETIISTGKPTGKKTGKCVVCYQEKNLAAHGMCWACYEKRKKADRKESVVTKSADKVEHAPPVEFPPFIPTPKQKPERAEIDKAVSNAVLVVAIHRVPGLVEWLEKAANDDLRTTSDQALWFLKRQMSGAEHEKAPS
jgi:hypothetical protein